jgi:hypothetical protein
MGLFDDLRFLSLWVLTGCAPWGLAARLPGSADNTELAALERLMREEAAK